jgi:hypothetical protein
MGRYVWIADEIVVVAFVFLLAFGAFRPLADVLLATLAVAALLIAYLVHVLRAR